MNEIIDFLEKENSSLQLSKILVKKKLPVVKDITKKIDLAIQNEKKVQEKKLRNIKTKTKPFKEIKLKKDVVWL